MQAEKVTPESRGKRQVLFAVVAPFQAFFRLEAAGGLVLMASALLALVWENSPLRSAYDAMVARAEGKKPDNTNTVYPNVNDGVEGMYFIQQCVASSRENGAWLPLKHKRARK